MNSSHSEKPAQAKIALVFETAAIRPQRTKPIARDFGIRLR
jgi:hypothetical protein